MTLTADQILDEVCAKFKLTLEELKTPKPRRIMRREARRVAMTRLYEETELSYDNVAYIMNVSAPRAFRIIRGSDEAEPYIPIKKVTR